MRGQVGQRSSFSGQQVDTGLQGFEFLGRNELKFLDEKNEVLERSIQMWFHFHVLDILKRKLNLRVVSYL